MVRLGSWSFEPCFESSSSVWGGQGSAALWLPTIVNRMAEKWARCCWFALNFRNPVHSLVETSQMCPSMHRLKNWRPFQWFVVC